MNKWLFQVCLICVSSIFAYCLVSGIFPVVISVRMCTYSAHLASHILVLLCAMDSGGEFLCPKCLVLSELYWNIFQYLGVLMSSCIMHHSLAPQRKLVFSYVSHSLEFLDVTATLFELLKRKRKNLGLTLGQKLLGKFFSIAGSLTSLYNLCLIFIKVR